MRTEFDGAQFPCITVTQGGSYGRMVSQDELGKPAGKSEPETRIVVVE